MQFNFINGPKLGTTSELLRGISLEILTGKKKVKNKGVHSKNKNSSNKSSKNYKKKYRGQGR